MDYLNLYDRNGNLLKEKVIRGVKTDNLVGIDISNDDFVKVNTYIREYYVQKYII